MSRTIDVAMTAHINSAITTLCTCWQVTRSDGVILGFTNHTRDISLSGVNYLAESGIAPTTVASSSDLSSDNMEIQAILEGDQVTTDDLISGVYDFAAVEVLLVNYADLTMTPVILHSGFLGEVQLRDADFTAEVRSLLQMIQNNILDLTSQTCRVKQLGDSQCKIDLTPFTYDLLVQVVTNQKTFTWSAPSRAPGSFADRWFDYGMVTFTSGLNVGRSMEIKSFLGDVFVLHQNMPFPVASGDHFTAVAGCDRLRTTCQIKFSNMVNFRGEPDVPGMPDLFKINPA